MRLRLVILMLLTTFAAFSATGVAAAAKPQKKKTKPSTGPTAQQIRTAVAAAERSPDLWATVNVCTSGTSDDEVGIRGQMPSLGFATTLLMNISLSYWNYTDMQFEPFNASSPLSLGKGTHGIHQGGVSFPVYPPAAGSMYLVRGAITFEWKLGDKILGKVVRNTGHGYPNVGFSDPPGYSSGTCTLT